MNAHARLKAKMNEALANQWGRKEVDCVEIDLPIPPSINRLWVPVNGGMVRSERYRTWWRAAGNELVRARPGRVSGAYALTLLVNRTESKADLNNLEKAVSDLLQEHGVIENDRRGDRIELEWSNAVERCRVIVRRWQARAA